MKLSVTCREVENEYIKLSKLCDYLESILGDKGAKALFLELGLKHEFIELKNLKIGLRRLFDKWGDVLLKEIIKKCIY